MPNFRLRRAVLAATAASTTNAPRYRWLVEAELQRVGRSIHAAFPARTRNPLRALDLKAMEMAAQDRSCAPPCSASWTSRRPAAVRRPGAPPDAATSTRSMPARRRSRRRCGCRHESGPAGARRGRRGGRAPHGAPLHRRRDSARGAASRSATCGSRAPRSRSTCSARRPSPRPRPTVTRRAASTRSRRSPRRPRAGPSGRCSRRLAGAAPARERVGEGLRAEPAAAPGGARGRPRRRRPADAAAARAGPRSWVRTCTSTWSRWTRSRPRWSWCSTCSTSPSCATDRPPGS